MTGSGPIFRVFHVLPLLLAQSEFYLTREPLATCYIPTTLRLTKSKQVAERCRRRPDITSQQPCWVLRRIHIAFGCGAWRGRSAGSIWNQKRRTDLHDYPPLFLSMEHRVYCTTSSTKCSPRLTADSVASSYSVPSRITMVCK